MTGTIADTRPVEEAEDPFHQVQREVQDKWRALNTGPVSARLSAAERAQRMRALEEDVRDLESAVEMARAEPGRFRISAAELERRGRFVRDMRGALARAGDGDDEDARARVAAAADHTALQVEAVRQQDEDLDHLSTAVQRIGALGRDMHNELEEQGELLQDLGGHFDGTLSRMKAVHARVHAVMERTGRKQFCTILWLSVIFFVLTVLVVVT